MKNTVYNNFTVVLLNTHIQICYCTDIDISTIINKYNNSNINLDKLNLYLGKNIWNRFYSLTISLLNLSNGKNYSYTIPSEILHEITDNNRLVVSYQCSCFNDFPNFTWFNLWELFINKNVFE